MLRTSHPLISPSVHPDSFNPSALKQETQRMIRTVNMVTVTTVNTQHTMEESMATCWDHTVIMDTGNNTHTSHTTHIITTSPNTTPTMVIMDMDIIHRMLLPLYLRSLFKSLPLDLMSVSSTSNKNFISNEQQFLFHYLRAKRHLKNSNKKEALMTRCETT